MRVLLTAVLIFSQLIGFGQDFKLYNSTNSKIISNNVLCATADKNFLWIGTSKGINRVEIENGKATSFSPRRTSVPVLSLKDGGEFLWVGLKDKGIYKMPKNTYKFIGFEQDFFANKTIDELFVSDSLLFVLSGVELFKVNTNNGAIQNISSKWDSYKLNNKIISILEKKINSQQNAFLKSGSLFINKDEIILSDLDEENISWCSTLINDAAVIFGGNKTYLFNSKQKQIVNVAKGFKVNPFSNIEFKNQKFIGTDKGLLEYSFPSKNNFSEPSIALNKIFLNGKLLENLPDKLPWNEYELEINLDDKNFTNPSTVTFYYRTNSDTTWKESKERLIKINNIPSGDFRLDIKALNNLGVYSSNNLTIETTITSSSTKYFIQYSIAAFIILIYTLTIVVLTRKKYRKDIKVLEDALLEKTNKLNKIEKSKYGLVDEDKVSI